MPSKDAPTPWQLRIFQKTLKKKLRIKALAKHIGELADNQRCLLVTCGDNNGAINYLLKSRGAKWSWADLEIQGIPEMADFLGDPVFHAKEDHLPFDDCRFDCVLSVDVQEHLNDPNPFTSELRRVTKKGGKVIVTVPNGDDTKPVVRLKRLVGMTNDVYGHCRTGFTIEELSRLLSANGIHPKAASSFSQGFTELLELFVNYGYVKILSKRSRAKVEKGTIAPSTKNQLKSVHRMFRVYSVLYPFCWTISRLDILFSGSVGYVIIVEGRKA
ncbi:MAG: methyltransferase domain-containing protein [Desulfobacterales bacterium]